MRKMQDDGWMSAAEQLIYAALGLLVGLAVGAVVGIFGRGVEFFSALGAAHFSLYVWFLPAVGILTVAMLRKWGKGNIGMAAAFRASRGETKGFPLRNVVFQFAGTWSAHLFCASVGREGAAIQIGAALGSGIGRNIPLRGAERILIVSGMAAGFSALFSTPVCALFFSLEVTIVGGLHLRALVASAVSSFTAWYTASLCGLSHTLIVAGDAPSLTLAVLAKLIVLGAAFGLTGFAFCIIRGAAGKFFRTGIKNAYLRVGLAGAMLACLLYLSGGRYSGLGTNLIEIAVSGGKIYSFDFIVKILFTAVTLAVGFLGGEVTTFFAAGTCLGLVLGEALGLPPVFAACLGYAAVFGAATNTLFAPVLLCVELFGGALLPHAAIVCTAAYLFNFNRSVYDQRYREGVTSRSVFRNRFRQSELPLLHRAG